MSEKGDEKAELEQTVEMLQQILEVMPSDVSTLKTLYNTHLQLGALEPALEVLARIEKAARAVRDEVALAFVLEQYASVEHTSPELKERTDHLRAMQEGLATNEEPVLKSPAKEGVFETGSLDSEMTLAWDLLQDELLTQDEYSEAVGDLAKMTSSHLGVPITLLHVLTDRNFSRFERLITHLSEKANVPIVLLESFEEHERARGALSLEFSCSRGALAFSMVEDDLLLAVLNPFDKELLAEAERESGAVCHPYLVSPYDYDKRLGERKKAIQEAGKEEE